MNAVQIIREAELELERGAITLGEYCQKVEPFKDVEPIKHGQWINCKGSNGKDYRKCSQCLHTQDITGLFNYCPNCGAKMDK